jgi:hypothetical protein
VSEDEKMVSGRLIGPHKSGLVCAHICTLYTSQQAIIFLKGKEDE